MPEPDEIIHQSMRLRIMATLNALPEGEAVEFRRLRDIVKATDGNIGAHLTTLENAGYVDVAKAFVGKRPRTSVRMSQRGREAFARHVAYLKDVLDGGALPG